MFILSVRNEAVWSLEVSSPSETRGHVLCLDSSFPHEHVLTNLFKFEWFIQQALKMSVKEIFSIQDVYVT